MIHFKKNLIKRTKHLKEFREKMTDNSQTPLRTTITEFYNEYRVKERGKEDLEVNVSIKDM